MNGNYFINFDRELIELIFFKQQEDKANYIELVQKTLASLGIDKTTSRIVAINRIADVSQNIPFILDILVFSNDYSFSGKTTRNKYYTTCKLCKFNLVNKIEAGVHNFEEEEMLLKEALSCDLSGYAKLDLLFKFGETFETIGQPNKRDYYFDLLRNGSYDISPSSVCQFYKLIAEIYISIGEYHLAQSWLRDAITIDPKFPVKRMIKQLENKLTTANSEFGKMPASE